MKKTASMKYAERELEKWNIRNMDADDLRHVIRMAYLQGVSDTMDKELKELADNEFYDRIEEIVNDDTL